MKDVLAPTPFQEAFLITFKLFRDEGLTPSVFEQDAYTKGVDYHGTFGSDLNQEAFEASFLVAITWAMLEKRPLPLFVPKVHNAWVTDQIRTLCRGALKRHSTCKDLVVSSLSYLQMNAPPWAFKDEPKRWVMFGFDRNPVILPSWLTSVSLCQRTSLRSTGET